MLYVYSTEISVFCKGEVCIFLKSKINGFYISEKACYVFLNKKKEEREGKKEKKRRKEKESWAVGMHFVGAYFSSSYSPYTL